MKIEFLKWGYHFQEDKDKRDIYLITLKKGNREYKFNFGNSIAHSGKYKVYSSIGLTLVNDKKQATKIKGAYQIIKNKEFQELTIYDVLGCLQKYDVGDLKNFCLEFGYDEDSRTAEKIYNAVVNEYNNLKLLFSDEELNKMGEIQ
jgi:hypothetical protein